MNPSRPLHFRDLPVGVTFQFEHGDTAPRYLKTGPGAYTRDGASYTVGSAAATVSLPARGISPTRAPLLRSPS